MSTPMETNTEELREILQTVYNLPDAGSGGSAEPDLVITPNENFVFNSKSTNNPTYHIQQVTFDPAQVISSYEKLVAGKDVRASLTGFVTLDSGSPKYITTYPSTRVLAYGPAATGHTNVTEQYLVVRFKITTGYFYLSGDGGVIDIEYRFLISATRDVSLQGAALWATT